MPVQGQYRFSITTDFGPFHSFKKDQRYTVFSHTVQAQFHITPADGAFIWFSYSAPGGFRNALTADAKMPGTFPQQIPFTNHASMRLKEFCVGWRHYLVGSSFREERISVYGEAGFGLMLGNLKNQYESVVMIDTAQYAYPANPVAGTGRFKRLTLDLALGWEVPLGAEIYFYNECRVLIPASDYPSKYLFVNQHAPLVAVLAAGVRIMF